MRKVTVIYHEEDGTWWSESTDRDLETFAAAGDSLEEVRALTYEGIAFYLDLPEVQLDERYAHTKPLLTYFNVESAANFAVEALTSATGTIAQRSVSPGQPRIVIC